jgi:hypothetical protein
MKTLAITLAAIMAVSCTLPAGAKSISASASGTTGVETETVQTETEEDSFKVEIVDELTVVTPYYTITVPDHWEDAYTFMTVDNFTGKWLKLFHTDPHTGLADGHLFSILLTEDEEYEKIADFDLIGELEDSEENEYHVIAVFPTDVQYTKEGRDAYMALFRDADTVLDSITPADGCVYEKY